MKSIPGLLLLIGLLGLTPMANAHETWLLPATWMCPVNQMVTLDLTSGMEFPEPDHSIKPDRVAEARVRLGDTTINLKNFEAGTHSLRIIEPLPREGLATIWLSLRPREIELNAKQVAEYFAEIDASPEVRAAWARQKGPWRETYTKHAKTFVAAGMPKADPSWKTAVGMGLELVPSTDPLALTAGSEVTFFLLSKGRPLANTSVGIMGSAMPKREFRKSNADGRVTFPIAKAGSYLVFAVDLRPVNGGETWLSDFTTVTIKVGR